MPLGAEHRSIRPCRRPSAHVRPLGPPLVRFPSGRLGGSFCEQLFDDARTGVRPIPCDVHHTRAYPCPGCVCETDLAMADRLTGLDSSFLHLEHDGAHMHVASTTLFEGPAPPYVEFREHIRSRLHLVPRFRQKVRFVPVDLGRPVWIDDPHLNLDYHVRHTSLPDARQRRAAAQARRAPLLASSSTAPSPSGSSGWSRAFATAASRSSARPTTAWSTASPGST